MAKIVLIHSESDSDVFPLLSLAIGLYKFYPDPEIIWIGEPYVLDLVKYNKRIHHCLDINQEIGLRTLKVVFGSDICVNLSFSNKARKFTSHIPAKKFLGFDKNGATSNQAEFFQGVISEKITTNKTILQMVYDVAELKWRGEGYGINYYPSTKQTKKCGLHAAGGDLGEEGISFKKNKKVLPHLDVINKFSKIMTDDLFTAHASIALRKHCTFIRSLPYQMEFFGRGMSRKIS